MVRDVIRLGVSREQFSALLIRRNDDERITIFTESRDHLAAKLECRGAVGGRLLDLADRQCDLTGLGEGNGQIYFSSNNSARPIRSPFNITMNTTQPL
jgi:hypothetical protein